MCFSNVCREWPISKTPKWFKNKRSFLTNSKLTIKINPYWGQLFNLALLSFGSLFTKNVHNINIINSAWSTAVVHTYETCAKSTVVRWANILLRALSRASRLCQDEGQQLVRYVTKYIFFYSINTKYCINQSSNC